MNCDNGNLRYLDECEEPNSNEVLLEDALLTSKQKELMKVSLHDNRSYAGKLRVETSNQRKRRVRKMRGK